MRFKRALRKALFRAQTWFIKAGAWMGKALTCIDKAIKRAAKKTALFVGKSVAGFFRWLGRVMDDILLLGGIGFLCYGVRMIYEPAGHIVLGLCLFGLAYLVAKKRK